VADAVAEPAEAKAENGGPEISLPSSCIPTKPDLVGEQIFFYTLYQEKK
jgi:hypothetical protein